MRFFDGDNQRFERALTVLSLVVALYILSYAVIRDSHAWREERDGCPSIGCPRVDLPMAVYYIYNPLIHLDRYVDHQTEFRFK